MIRDKKVSRTIMKNHLGRQNGKLYEIDIPYQDTCIFSCGCTRFPKETVLYIDSYSTLMCYALKELKESHGIK